MPSNRLHRVPKPNQSQSLIRGTEVTIRSIAVGASVLLMLASCSNKYDTITPEIQAKMMGDLQAGNLTLDCGPKCGFTWLAQKPQIHQLDLAEKWQDLAIKVQQIGYGSDLAYYYMGQAAQGLGYHQAAITYYTTSLGISTGADPLLRCEAGQNQNGDPCEGVDLVSSIPVLIQASRDALAQQAAATAAANAPAPTYHHRHKKPASSTTNTGGSGWAVPPPPASSGSGSGGSSSGGGSAGGAGWAAPPPPSN
jgi:uncharacterized membrane protein YgcG